jgi:hypothetical protein
MNAKEIAVSLTSLMVVVAFQAASQTYPAQMIKGKSVAGVPVVIGNSDFLRTMADGDGLTHGTGQFGAPTVSACYYDYRTHVIANFPANISSGWIKTDERSNPDCIPPGGLPQPNWEEMTYFMDLPVGTVLKVCWNANTWPANWTPISYTKDPTMCGYWPSGVPSDGYPNVMYIRRDS